MSNTVTFGKAVDRMLLGCDYKKDTITFGAIFEVITLKRMVEYGSGEFEKQIASEFEPSNVPTNTPNKFVVEPSKKPTITIFNSDEYVTIKQLSKVLKWSYDKISHLCYLGEFVDIICKTQRGRAVRIEDVPKFCALIYECMREPA